MGGRQEPHARKHYQPFIPTEIKTYSEPFFGAGAMFLQVMKFLHSPQRVVINDINSGLMNIYRCIRDDYPEFLSHLDRLDRTYIRKGKPVARRASTRFATSTPMTTRLGTSRSRQRPSISC